MSTERLYRTEGIVIRRRDQGEADRVLTLCTPLGKIEAIAKGARKVRSRKAGHVELFTRSNFVISRVQNSWDIVSQAETVEPHELLRSDLLRGAYARYAIELLDSFFAQEEGGQTLLDLLDHALARLCQGDDPDLVWVRRNPEHANSVQFAYKTDLIGNSGYMWSAWADDGLKAVNMRDYNDRYTEEAAGNPYPGSPLYPIRSIYLFDSTCRSFHGFTPTGNEPGLCP